MKPFEKCPVCEGELETRQVDKIAQGRREYGVRTGDR